MSVKVFWGDEPVKDGNRISVRLLNKALIIPSRIADLRDRFAPGTFARLREQVRPHSMLTAARLRALHNAVRHVVKEGVPGSIVECGTAAGGSAAMMALTLKELGEYRDAWLFDTFEGLPAPTEHDPEDAGQFTGEFRAEVERVRSTFEGFGLTAHFVKGLFRDTLPSSETGPIAVLHVDGDWYESVMDCLVHLYERVSRGGLIQFDDYGHWEGARKAVDEFMRERRISAPLRYVDYSARQLVKP